MAEESPKPKTSRWGRWGKKYSLYSGSWAGVKDESEKSWLGPENVSPGEFLQVPLSTSLPHAHLCIFSYKNIYSINKLVQEPTTQATLWTDVQAFHHITPSPSVIGTFTNRFTLLGPTFNFDNYFLIYIYIVHPTTTVQGRPQRFGTNST